GVPVVEVAADADRRRLLPRVQVDEPGDLAGGELRVHPFLELADRPHHPVDVQQVLSGQSLPLNRVGHGLLPGVGGVEVSRPRRAVRPRSAGTSPPPGPAGRSPTAAAPPGPDDIPRSSSSTTPPARAPTRITCAGLLSPAAPTP